MAQKSSPKDYSRWDGKVGVKVTNDTKKKNTAKPKTTKKSK